MKRLVGTAVALGAVALHALAYADTCPNADRDHAFKLKAVAEDLMKAATGKPLEGKEQLDTVRSVPGTIRQALAAVQCDDGALNSKERAEMQAFATRATAWADRTEKLVAEEVTARTSIVVPLCEATWGLDSARKDLAREKANPSGVVDLQRLHSAGEAIQHWQSVIDALRPQYAAFRHHPFTDWHTEGACVAASKAE